MSAVEFASLDDATRATTQENPWVIEKQSDGKFVVTDPKGPHPKGAVVYVKPEPVDPTTIDYNTLGRAVDATSAEYPNVLRKKGGAFVVSAKDATVKGATLVYAPNVKE